MRQKLLLNNVERDTRALFELKQVQVRVSWIPFKNIFQRLRFCIPPLFRSRFFYEFESIKKQDDVKIVECPFFFFYEYSPCFINNYLPFLQIMSVFIYEIHRYNWTRD